MLLSLIPLNQCHSSLYFAPFKPMLSGRARQNHCTILQFSLFKQTFISSILSFVFFKFFIISCISYVLFSLHSSNFISLAQLMENHFKKTIVPYNDLDTEMRSPDIHIIMFTSLQPHIMSSSNPLCIGKKVHIMSKNIIGVVFFFYVALPSYFVTIK